MVHVLFMIIPVILIAVSAAYLIDSTNRRGQLFWATVFVIALAVLLVHIGTMDFLPHGH
jgi:hypothetical protein